MKYIGVTTLFIFKCKSCGEELFPDEKGRVYIDKNCIPHELKQMEMPEFDNFDMQFHCCDPQMRKYGRLEVIGFIDISHKDKTCQAAQEIVDSSTHGE